MIIVKGKLIEFVWNNDATKRNQVAIELSPPTPEEISNLKEGDEVLVKSRIVNTGYKCIVIDGAVICENNVIAILPQPQQECICGAVASDYCPIHKPQQEFCECKEPKRTPNKSDSEYGMYCICGKPLRAMKDPNLEVGHIIGADKLAYALLGKIRKLDKKGELREEIAKIISLDRHGEERSKCRSCLEIVDKLLSILPKPELASEVDLAHLIMANSYLDTEEADMLAHVLVGKIPKIYNEDVIFMCKKHTRVNCGECFEVLPKVAKPEAKKIEELDLSSFMLGSPDWVRELQKKLNELIRDRNSRKGKE